MVRLIILVILFLFSLLTVFKAPAYYLWLLAILVSEYSYVFIAVTALFLIAKRKAFTFKSIQTWIVITAILLYINPLIQASIIAQHLKSDLTHTFGPELKKSGSLNLFGFINGVGNQNLTPRKLTYSNQEKLKLNLDFYAANKSGLRPCVIVIHGGSWKSGDNKQLPELNSILANEGFHVAAINYRLAPNFKSPAAVEDVKAALNFLKKNSQRLRIDTANFVLLGRSAGAQIALLAAYKFKNTGVKGVVDFYGPADMVWGYSVPANPLVMDSRKVMEDYLGGSYNLVPDRYKASSPLLYVDKTSVPTLIIHGKNDVLVAYEHSIRLSQKLTEAGVPNYFLSLPWATHGFDFNINGPGGQLSTIAVKFFISKITSDTNN